MTAEGRKEKHIGKPKRTPLVDGLHKLGKVNTRTEAETCV